MTSSEHSLDELVDELLSVAPDAAVLVGVSLGSESLLGGVELEGPEEVVGLLEVGAHGGDLVDEVLDRGQTLLSEHLLDDRVVSQRDARAGHLAVAALVDQLADGCLRGVAVGHVGLNSSDHVHRRLVQTDEDAVVQLSQAEQTQDLFARRVQLVDTIKLVKICGYILNNKVGKRTSLEYAKRTRQVLSTYPLVLMTKASLASGSTKKLPAFLAFLRASTSEDCWFWYSL